MFWNNLCFVWVCDLHVGGEAVKIPRQRPECSRWTHREMCRIESEFMKHMRGSCPCACGSSIWALEEIG